MKDKQALNQVIKQVYNQEKPKKDNFFKDLKDYRLKGHLPKDKKENKDK
jgi:hypothetical protein